MADPLVEAIKLRLPKVRVGPGSDPDAEMGPLVTKQHRDKVASYLDSGPAQGARVVAAPASSLTFSTGTLSHGALGSVTLNGGSLGSVTLNSVTLNSVTLNSVTLNSVTLNATPLD